MDNGLRIWLTIFGLGSLLVLIIEKNATAKVGKMPIYIEFLLYGIILFSILSLLFFLFQKKDKK